jgi:hypothetical protein
MPARLGSQTRPYWRCTASGESGKAGEVLDKVRELERVLARIRLVCRSPGHSYVRTVYDAHADVADCARLQWTDLCIKTNHLNASD